MGIKTDQKRIIIEKNNYFINLIIVKKKTVYFTGKTMQINGYYCI